MTQEEIINLAAQSFCQVPEVYSVLFEKQGAAPLSNEEIQQIKTNPEETLKALGQNKEFLSLIVETYANNQEEIINAVKSAKESEKRGMFKKGGKLAFLTEKFQKPSRPLPSQDFYIKEGSTDKQAMRYARKYVKSVADDGRASKRKLGASVSKTGNKYVYEKSIVGEPGRGTTTETYTIISPAGDTTIQQKFPVYEGAGNIGMANKTYKKGDPQYDTIMNRFYNTGVFDALKFYNEGGKLSEENEANKKYIKASEKAGQQASKKMSDLKNKHKAELKKIEKGQRGAILGPNGKPVLKIPMVLSDGTVVDPMDIESLAKYYNVPFVRRDTNYPDGYAVERTITVYPDGTRDTTGVFNDYNLSSIQLEQLRRGKDINAEALRGHFNKLGTYRAVQNK